MLPTPSTSHLSFSRIYEPAEDSYLLLDTLSSLPEITFLKSYFPSPFPTPLILEIGTGSGVILSFLHTNSKTIFGREILTLGVDINQFACEATIQTISVAEKEKEQEKEERDCGFYLGNILGDLGTSLKEGEIDVLVFNPPYVPTPNVPIPIPVGGKTKESSFEEESRLLELSYAGGEDGMEVTNRLLEELSFLLNRERACAYILLCAQNKPESIKEWIRGWGEGWRVETVGRSGKKAGWEKLVVIRIWRVGSLNKEKEED